ncbi:PspA-associated protein PspAA [uncultured Tessaracoccus sp.]|uniref:PspA-associated protein PspAA n=1 Tax=uncultured Tessaracoccus sp. TaxID=905023 RepID=UPI0025FE2D13|nr:hypothetical protein [uncultured Tessaracoccus sp.]
MIVRVLGEGQWTLEVEALERLNDIDRDLEQAVRDDDQEALAGTLRRLFDAVRELGTAVPDDVIVESDLVLPDPGASVEEVRGLIEATTEYYGIIPDGDEPEQDSAQA